MRLTTKSGKPIINRDSKLPIYSSQVDYRIKKAKQELGINSAMSHDDRMNMIRSEWSSLSA